VHTESDPARPGEPGPAGLGPVGPETAGPGPGGPEPAGPDEVLAAFHRDERSRLIAALVARFRDLDLAEDAAQEAMEAALTRWPTDGVPDSPLAWLITTARRKALDRVRRDDTLARRVAELAIAQGDVRAGTERTAPGADDVVETHRARVDHLPDDRLTMLLGCCHPAIAPADRVALMLRFVGGLTTAEAAAALLVPVPTLQARITRAKKRIVANRIPMTGPQTPKVFEERLPLVLTAIALVFTEGQDATAGADRQRSDLTGEAVRLARLLHSLLPGRAEPAGLLAVVLLGDARRGARVDADGVPVPLEDQDRSAWDAEQVAEGIALAERAASLPDAGPFAIQGAIAGVHAEAGSFEETDWAQVVALYDLLLARGADPIVEMNRAIAVGRRDSPEAGLALLEGLQGEPELADHAPYAIALAMFHEELAHDDDARRHYERARRMAANAAFTAFVDRRLAGLGPADR
jgi:RNA polymerase sigma-70 factor (ECF subfamily)